MDFHQMGAEKHEFSPRVFLLKVARRRMLNNNYLIVDPASHQAVVVDPAWQMEVIQDAVASTGSTLSGVLITHAHFDHIDLAKPVAEFYNCPIWMSRREIDACGFEARHLVAIDDTPWFVGEMLIQPILTPGHTPGCVCYYIGGNLFTGDVLFVEGCGMCGDIEAAHQMFDSLELLKARLPPQTHIFPGHTYARPPGQRFSEVLRHNMYLHFADKHSFASFRLRKGQSEQAMLNFR